MAKHRTLSIDFKRQFPQKYLAGKESLLGLARRHDICCNLIRVWVAKYEAGEFDEVIPDGTLRYVTSPP